MPIELKIPEAGESVTEIEIGAWLKNVGDHIEKDEAVVSLESDKATMDLSAPQSGTLTQVLKQKGELAKVGEVIGYLEKNGEGGKPSATPVPKEKPKAETKPEEKSEPPQEAAPKPEKKEDTRPKIIHAGKETVEPAAKPEPPNEDRAEITQPAEVEDIGTPEERAVQPDRPEEVVRMSRLRRTMAKRLVDAQHQAALLTTFNEVDMGAVMALRKEHGEAFQKKYNARLGFMSFFVKACIDALKQFPVLNAEVRGDDIVYHNYFDIGIAIGGGKGLVVPVLRSAESLSFAEIEITIADLANRAKANTLKVEELQGGTFTITNGGIYGSMLSTPIVNPPQSGILGLHAIQDRPVAREGNVVIRPMMFIALTYDHRIVDGREAVSCLKRIKDVIENPSRMLIEI